MTVVEEGKEVHIDVNVIGEAVAAHKRELELAYDRRKQEFLEKYQLKSLPKNESYTALGN